MRPSKYELTVTMDDGAVLIVPLPLDGREKMERAISAFEDAIAVSKHEIAKASNRQVVSCDRIDGIPSPEDLLRIGEVTLLEAKAHHETP